MAAITTDREILAISDDLIVAAVRITDAGMLDVDAPNELFDALLLDAGRTA
jgi:hypothetical protein